MSRELVEVSPFDHSGEDVFGTGRWPQSRTTSRSTPAEPEPEAESDDVVVLREIRDAFRERQVWPEASP